MFEQPILIYSDYCQYCSTFIKTLQEDSQLNEMFRKLNIDIDEQTGQRPEAFYQVQQALDYSISEVPTIVIDNGEYVLSGDEAFKWLEFKSKKEDDLQAFNPIEMGSFSDSYAKYGSNELHDATEQTFRFIHKSEEMIPTPQEIENAVSDVEYSKKTKERESNVPKKPIQAKEGFFNVTQNNSKKTKDVDNLLQKLINERENLVPVQTPQVKPDFTSGKVY